jgi:hypothetical protein
MDEIVKQAMAKWPNVPHCYGWLVLDARGNWRMRDERAQALKPPGDRISNPALLGFINRNYTHDEQGRWYFQNGPQRVYVNLELTPFIVRTDPTQGLVLHTGNPLPPPERVWMIESGQLVFQAGDFVAALDDRDVAQCLSQLYIEGKPASDENLLAWLERDDDNASLTFDAAGTRLPVKHLRQDALATQFGFNPNPAAEPA